jgi:hypothetical protein
MIYLFATIYGVCLVLWFYLYSRERERSRSAVARREIDRKPELVPDLQSVGKASLQPQTSSQQPQVQAVSQQPQAQTASQQQEIGKALVQLGTAMQKGYGAQATSPETTAA